MPYQYLFASHRKIINVDASSEEILTDPKILKLINVKLTEREIMWEYRQERYEYLSWEHVIGFWEKL